MNEQTEPKVVEGEVVGRSALAAPREVDELERLERRAALMPRLIELSIRSTHPAQWMNIQGKPWPTGAACEVMARTCGVKISDLKIEKEWSRDDKGEFYIWQATGRFSLPSEFDSIIAIGTCSSRDEFLGTETSKGRKLSEIDEGNIKKAAFTNMEVNGITRLLGVRNFDWERLKKYGIDKDGLQAVEFESGAKGGKAREPALAEVMKFGPAKGQAFADMSDADLETYKASFTAELPDPEKAKFKKKNETRIEAITAELARRANEKSGTAAPKQASTAGYWERLKALAGGLSLTEDQLKATTKRVLQKDKVTPAELTEAEFKAIADAVGAEAKEAAAKKESF
jgi:hypothetical protein